MPQLLMPARVVSVAVRQDTRRLEVVDEELGAQPVRGDRVRFVLRVRRGAGGREEAAGVVVRGGEAGGVGAEGHCACGWGWEEGGGEVCSVAGAAIVWMG